MPITIADLPDISRTHKNAAEAVAFAIAALDAALSVPRYSMRRASRPYYELRRDMPYIIHDLSIPGTFILVNRNYKPLGSNQPTEGEFAVYEDFTNLHVCLTSSQIASVVSPPHERGLFGDGNPPWSGRKEANAYLARLRLLHSQLKPR